MAKKVIKEQDNTFIDEVSGITYQWLKEEVEQVNSISCWSAKDQWGNKDYFVVKEGKILKGPYRTVKETCEALEEGLNDNQLPVDDEPTEERVNAGIVDQLRQASTQVTELIRKCEELIQWTDDEGKDDLVAVLKDIVGVESENIGKIQTMIGSLSDTAEAIDDGAEKAEEIMKAEDDEVVFGIEDDESFDEIPAMPIGFQAPPFAVAQPQIQLSNDNPNDTSNIIAKRYALDADEFDDDLIGF